MTDLSILGLTVDEAAERLLSLAPAVRELWPVFAVGGIMSRSDRVIEEMRKW